MRERELKPGSGAGASLAARVAPHAGARIETVRQVCEVASMYGRSPCGSASEKRDFFVLALFAIAARLLV